MIATLSLILASASSAGCELDVNGASVFNADETTFRYELIPPAGCSGTYQVFFEQGPGHVGVVHIEADHATCLHTSRSVQCDGALEPHRPVFVNVAVRARPGDVLPRCLSAEVSAFGQRHRPLACADQSPSSGPERRVVNWSINRDYRAASPVQSVWDDGVRQYLMFDSAADLDDVHVSAGGKPLPIAFDEASSTLAVHGIYRRLSVHLVGKTIVVETKS